MGFLSRDQILAASDIKPSIQPVPVPEWGDIDAVVGVRCMSGAEYDYFDEQVANAPGASVKNLRPLVCALTLCDEEGNRLFSVQEVDALAEKSAVAIERVYEKACQINRLRQRDREALEKNESTAQDVASGSPSPDSLADAPSENGKPLWTPESSSNGN